VDTCVEAGGDRDGRDIHVDVIGDSHEPTDATGSPEFENRLARLRLELVAESIANLSHDLGGAMMGIANYGELLEIAPLGTDERKAFVERLSKLHDRAAVLVKQLRRVSSLRSESRSMELRELLESAASIVECAYRRDGIALVPDLPDTRSVWLRRDEATQALVFVLDLARRAALTSHAGESRSVDLRVLDDRSDARLSLLVLAPGTFDLGVAEQRALLVAMLDRAGANLESADEGRLLITFPTLAPELSR